MPKLDQQLATTVESSEGTQGYPVLPPGKYLATLNNVEERFTREGYPSWSAEFSELRDADGVRHPGRTWLNLNLPMDPKKVPADYQPRTSSKPPAEAWAARQNAAANQLKAFFAAFDTTSDTDTDDLVGREVVLKVTNRTIQSGPKVGELVANVAEIHPASTWIAGSVGDSTSDDF